MSNSITFIRIDKKELHDRANDKSSFNSTLEIIGGVEEGLLLIGIAHDDLAIKLMKTLEDVPIDTNSKLKVYGEIKSRTADGITYWLISDYIIIDNSKTKSNVSLVPSINHHEFEHCLRDLLEGGDKIPLIFKFKEKIKIDGLMKSEKDELLTICSLLNNSRGQTDIYLESRLNSQYRYPISIVPKNSCCNILLHPDYKPLSQLPSGSYKSSNQFKEDVLEIVGENQRTVITIWFTSLVYIPAYSLTPTDHINVEVMYRKLSKDNGRTWDFYLNFFTRKGSRKFYFADYFPFRVIKGVTEFAELNDGFFVTTTVGSKKPLRLTKKDVLLRFPTKISIYELLSDSSKSKIRSDSSCLLCGKAITTMEPTYVHLDIDGYLRNSPVPDSDHYGFFKIGPECAKKVPEEYLFGFKDIATNQQTQELALKATGKT